MAERRRVVEQYRKSGLTQKDFAAERQMTLSTLVRWLGDARLSAPEPKVVAAQFHSLALPAVAGWAAEIEQPSGAIIRLHASTPPELAAAILKASR